jgi:hypothetical protein
MVVINVSDITNGEVLRVMTAPKIGNLAYYDDNTTFILASGPAGLTTNSFAPRH